MKKLVILTGCEPRHTFMRKCIAMSKDLDVLRTYCEGDEQSLRVRLQRGNAPAHGLQARHVDARARSEEDFFRLFNVIGADPSNPVSIKKGAINEAEHVDAVADLEPDFIAAFGCSLIREPLISRFPRRFLNLHLGLSPYYRGSGTNFFPLVDGRPEFVGATFMYLDAGIDTGEIIHQIRARVFPGDTPHQIGNRLIGDAAIVYTRLLECFDELEPMQQPSIPEDARLCVRADFTEEATQRLYRNFEDGMVEHYLKAEASRCEATPIVTQPCLRDVLR